MSEADRAAEKERLFAIEHAAEQEKAKIMAKFLDDFSHHSPKKQLAAELANEK